MKRALLIAVGALLIVSAIFFYEVLLAPNTFTGDRFIIVSRGESFRSVVDSLEKAGVIRSRLLFELAGRTERLTTTIQIGKYRFSSGMSNREILRDIHAGLTVEMITVTIPEGLRPQKQARILSQKLGIDSARFMQLVSDSLFAAQVGVSAGNLIGYLYPNTYKFYWQVDEAEIIRTQVGEFWKVFDDTLREEAKLRGMSINAVLAMASIVEGETNIDSERAVIAGVYYNRLQRGMRLQADPTVLFTLDTDPRRLYHSDLKRLSLYNTYQHTGLPPGPINNPGKSSIMAALRPRHHHYYYFVATGIGGHSFSTTFVQHLKAAKNYHKVVGEQKNKKEG
jgi:UPF0755 protein